MKTIRGSRYEVGFQLGTLFQEVTRKACREAQRNPPPIQDVPTILDRSRLLIRKILPHMAEEIRGIADGAGVSEQELLLFLFEELWDSEESESGCTDIAAVGRATANGRLLVGHNNDEAPSTAKPHLLRLIPEGGPEITTVSLGGIGPSVGCNDYGLVLTGNALYAKDVKVGIPRIVLVRAALEEPTMLRAAKLLLHPERASSYNNVLADQGGQVVSMEGSGSAARILKPTDSGILSHSNHYLHPEMKHLDSKEDRHSTVLREQRSCHLMEQFAGKHTLRTFARVLRDHKGYPDGICRHGSDAVTGFSIIFEPERRRFWYAEGRPCQNRYRYWFY